MVFDTCLKGQIRRILEPDRPLIKIAATVVRMIMFAGNISSCGGWFPKFSTVADRS